MLRFQRALDVGYYVSISVSTYIVNPDVLLVSSHQIHNGDRLTEAHYIDGVYWDVVITSPRLSKRLAKSAISTHIWLRKFPNYKGPVPQHLTHVVEEQLLLYHSSNGISEVNSGRKENPSRED